MTTDGQKIREEDCNLCVNAIVKKATDSGVETPEQRQQLIDQTVNKFSEMMEIDPFSEEELDYITKNVEYQLSVTMKPGSALVDTTYAPWYFDKKSQITPRFWTRFIKFLNLKLPQAVTGRLDMTTSEIMDYAGDPCLDGKFQRKGLVMGDIQSGKTNCYLGLINKALDAGYNVIIVLAGISEPLRAQTQMRVDEAVIGFDSNPEKNKQILGVGEYGSLPIFSITSTISDFQSAMKSSNPNMESPIVLVVKKNVKILENIHDWLDVPQLKNAEGLIDRSLMVIDDEADNASVNTAKENDDPTHTNRSIRAILALFARSSYIGYTATPYANIFIKPNTYDEMIKEDLFPKDFIYAMWPPSNYIGPCSIFGENGSHSYMLRTIPNEEKLLEGNLKHKKTARFETMPSSMKDAVACFFIACTMRDLNSDSEAPMSMMIHISRFIDVQSNVLSTISDSIDKLKEDIVSYCGLPQEEALKHGTIKFVHDVWAREYSSLVWPQNTWESIQARMPFSTNRIKTLAVNSENDKRIDYRKNPSLRAIVIGGNALTRGLTLEGLMVSYFYRKSPQYDTLLQMGRWFGYKDGYAELCRVWTNPDVQSWFGYVGRVNHELKLRIDDMCEQKKTPMQYGLIVQEDITGFTMTSANKMRSSGIEYVTKNLAGDVRDTKYIYVDRKNVAASYKALNEFFNTHSSELKQRPNNGNVVFEGISYIDIIDLLGKIRIPSANEWYDHQDLARYISNIDHKVWDVAVLSKDRFAASGRELYSVCNKFKIYSPFRSRFEFKKLVDSGSDLPEIILMGNRNLKSPSDFEEFLTKDQIDEVKRKRGDTSPSAQDYMIQGRNPVLLIYYLELDPDGRTNKELELYYAMMDSLDDLRPVGVAIGFPSESDESPEQNRIIRYRANEVAQRLAEAQGYDAYE